MSDKAQSTILTRALRKTPAPCPGTKRFLRKQAGPSAVSLEFLSRRFADARTGEDDLFRESCRRPCSRIFAPKCHHLRQSVKHVLPRLVKGCASVNHSRNFWNEGVECPIRLLRDDGEFKLHRDVSSMRTGEVPHPGCSSLRQVAASAGAVVKQGAVRLNSMNLTSLAAPQSSRRTPPSRWIAASHG